MTKTVVVCDLDGTLGDAAHRQHLAQAQEWDTFNAASWHDEPIAATTEALAAFMARGYIIVLCTGRNEKYRELTLEWLKIHNIAYHRLLMRPEANFDSDTVVKPLLLTEHGYPPEKVLCILEDRTKVVATWRELGYTCWQVAAGSY